MAKAIARFSGGALHPLEPLDLAEGQEVLVGIEEAPSPDSPEEAAPSESIAPRPELAEAMQELDEAASCAEEDGLGAPSEIAFENARRLLEAMHRISPRRYGVYPDYDGYITIDARGANDSIMVVMCGSDGGALCLATIDNEPRRARYSTARNLPDGFIREALLELGEDPAP